TSTRPSRPSARRGSTTSSPSTPRPTTRPAERRTAKTAGTDASTGSVARWGDSATPRAHAAARWRGLGAERAARPRDLHCPQPKGTLAVVRVHRPLGLHAELGEGYGDGSMGDDAAMLEVVTTANVACGGHAGDGSTMRAACRAAAARGVALTAHVA